MSRNYRYGWELADLGFQAIHFSEMTPCELNKSVYVDSALNASVHDAGCGWYGVSYVVCTIGGENRTEFVMMFADKNDTPTGARWINVTGESKGSIAEGVWSTVFA